MARLAPTRRDVDLGAPVNARLPLWVERKLTQEAARVVQAIQAAGGGPLLAGARNGSVSRAGLIRAILILFLRRNGFTPAELAGFIEGFYVGHSKWREKRRALQAALEGLDPEKTREILAHLGDASLDPDAPE